MIALKIHKEGCSPASFAVCLQLKIALKICFGDPFEILLSDQGVTDINILMEADNQGNNQGNNEGNNQGNNGGNYDENCDAE